ncbi:carbohydrate ABC transporter permease [Paenibacillus radicis (ex Xue et al. 2023)]|uniref:Carbohydrate ABC transporter permease n=1 Tax=Paenibacillus radicis (ex Xue et al. 2023) TaxID=2972489 RepID=A0ABT1YCL8_9BACL|nr:carbohydrate ABC transporter permease [Paenibacillus radicis (ex Xue et al. 2023)]MCR8629953.1 carbohydrate ABC transporter permease [Paenibacillus radicis (ex Xue et al. 2023)]
MKRQKSSGFEVINYALLGLMALLMIFPFWNVLVMSFSTSHLVYEGQLLFWPKQWTTAAYNVVFQNRQFIQTLQNTVFITIVGTVISMILTTTLAYPLSKRTVKGASVMLFIAFFTMLFNGGIIPSYLLVKQLGMLNSLWSLIIPSALSVFNLMIMVSFFRSLPSELEESAKMDGCNDIGVLLRIIVPISLPVIATLTLFYAVSKWNIFFQAVMYNSDVSKMTMQVLLRQILVQMTSDAVDAAMSGDTPKIGVTVKMAMIIIATVPILLIYPFLQKYFAKGAMIGSVKG